MTTLIDTETADLDALQARRGDLLVAREAGEDVDAELTEVEHRIEALRREEERAAAVTEARERQEREAKAAEAERVQWEAADRLPAEAQAVLDAAETVDSLVQDLGAAMQGYQEKRRRLTKSAGTAKVGGIGGSMGRKRRTVAHSIQWQLHQASGHSPLFERPAPPFRAPLADLERTTLRRVLPDDEPADDETDVEYNETNGSDPNVYAVHVPTEDTETETRTDAPENEGDA